MQEPADISSAGNQGWYRYVIGYDEHPSAFAMHMENLNREPTLDVSIVSHCNLNCASCSYFSPIAAPAFLELADYVRDLEKLAAIEGAAEFFEAICLMGGEPLLHPELPAFIRATHDLLPKAQTRVVTNGLLLDSMPSAFWEAMRAARADLLITPYPCGLDHAALADLARSEGIDVGIGGGLTRDSSGNCYFMRIPIDDAGTQNPTSSFVACPSGGSTMQLLDGKIFPCNQGALLGIVNARFGTSFSHAPDDYLELDKIGSIDDIDRLRRTAHPMCRYCASSKAERIDWHPSRGNRFEWLARPDERDRASRES